MSVDDFARALGFKNYQELGELVDKVDISTPEKQNAFNDWRDNDGTKEGLLILLSGK